MWEVREEDLPAISIGAAAMGTGGGGNAYLGMIHLREQLRRGLRVRVVEPDRLEDDWFLMAGGFMGAPVVSYEKLRQGHEEIRAFEAVQEHVGRKVDAVAAMEIGGENSMTALSIAAELDVPVVDGDGMGRAFPELQMVTFFMYGGRPWPAAVADDKGNTVVIHHVRDARSLERIARAITIEMGGSAGLAMAPMSGVECRRSIVPGTLSLTRRIGRAVLDARAAKRSTTEALLSVTGGSRLFRGKVVDVERRLAGGFVVGHLDLEGFDEDAGARARIDFQNENLIIWKDGVAIACVPDLITLLTADEGEPVTTELVRYGIRADVVGIPCHPRLATETALQFVGPRAFGFDVEYRPLRNADLAGNGVRTPSSERSPP